MSDLREAAEMALDYIRREGWTNSQGKEVFIALSQALAMERFSEVNQEIEEALKQPKQKPAACEHEWVRKSGMLPGDWFCICCGEWKYRTAPVDAVNISQERVEGWGEGFKAVKSEWVERDLAPVFDRFAELIVKECLNNMENCDGDLDFAIWKTKNDFGVEE